MAHFAIVAPAAAGHLTPQGCLATELQRLGHRVTLVAHANAAPFARQWSLPHRELPVERAPRYRRPPRLLVAASWLLGKDRYVALRTRFRYHAECYLALAPAILEDLGVDGVIVDQDIVAGGTVAERRGLPFVTVCSSFPWNGETGVPPAFTGWPYSRARASRFRNRLGYAAWRAYMRPALRSVNRQRAAWRLRPLRYVHDTFSTLAQIVQGCAAFDYPRRELAPTFHYVGSLTADRPAAAADFPWERLDGRPLVYACLGTVGDRRNLITLQKIAAGCAGLDAQLLMSKGSSTPDRAHLPEGLSNLPGDPLVLDFVPQTALLQKADLLITHAGLNTVMESLSQGVPMVALPRGADQPAVAARVEYAGVGLRASFVRFLPAELQRLAHRVLTECAFREKARELREIMAAAGGVRRAARIVEQALTTGQPVERASHGGPDRVWGQVSF